MAENQVLMTEAERFREICAGLRDSEHIRNGIGTYKEKSVHLALKILFEENEECREVPVGKYIADIKNDTGIHEIQTSGFGSMRQKLEEYLSLYKVELIYPVIERRRVVWISPDTGEVVKSYNSPRHVRPAEIFKELLYLGDVLTDPGLSFTIVSLGAEETRFLDGIDAKKKRRATRYDTFPTELIGIRRYSSVYQMAELFPYGDGDTFTGEDIRKYLRAQGRKGWAALKVMEKLGIAERCGKEGNRIIYKFSVNSSDGCCT